MGLIDCCLSLKNGKIGFTVFRHAGTRKLDRRCVYLSLGIFPFCFNAHRDVGKLVYFGNKYIALSRLQYKRAFFRVT